MKLADLQHAFVDAVYDNISEQLSTQIKGTPEFSVSERLGVYQNNTRETLYKALKQAYPLIKKTVGEKYFRQIAHEYINNHPSQAPDLNGYGNLFNEFLLQQVNTKKELSDYQYLPDLSLLEWHLNQAYYTNNRNDFDFSRFARLNQSEQQKVLFHVSDDVFIQKTSFPVFAVWQRHQTNTESINYDDAQETFYVLVHRPEFKPKPVEINKQVYELLYAIKQTMPLSALAEQVPEQLKVLDTCIQHGWVDSFSVGEV